MIKTITKYFRNGKAVILMLIALNILAVFWVAGIYVDMKKEEQVRAAQQQEENSHVAEFTKDNKKMLSTFSKCNKIGISYSSMSSEVSTHENDLQYHMLEKLIDNVKSGEGVRLTLSTDYWKSSGLKCEYSYTHKAELYKLLPEEK